jgi:hypothetical protein
MRQVPMGPENLVCPLHKKAMSAVCHKCPLWSCLRGTNPQTGEEIDRWDCSLAHLPMLLVETSQQVRQVGAATESFRNEVVRRSDAVRPVNFQGHERLLVGE